MSAAPIIERDGLEIVDVPPPPGANDDVPAADFTKPVVVDADGTLAPRKPAVAVTIEDILGEWRRDRPLVHQPIGLPTLDRMTNGGPAFGDRVFLVGPPDVAKTLFIAQTADNWARSGIAVGILSIDEEAGDLITRFAQRAGFTRRQCEDADPGTLDRIARALRDLPLKIYRDPKTTIEDAAEGLLAFMAENGIKRGALFVDSVQKVTCRALQDGRDRNKTQIVSANVDAVRAVGIEHKLIVFATSETSRAFYRSAEDASKLDKMAAAKESGDVEYAARLMLFMSYVKDNPDLLHIDVPKNKLGQRGEFFLKVDRDRQTLEDADAPENTRGEEISAGAVADHAAVLNAIIQHPNSDRDELMEKLRLSGTRMGAVRIGGILKSLKKDNKIDEVKIKGARGPAATCYVALVDKAHITPPPPPPVGMHIDDDNEALLAAMEN